MTSDLWLVGGVGVGEGQDLKNFWGFIVSYLLNNVQSGVHDVFPICSWCIFYIFFIRFAKFSFILFP